MNSTFAYSAWNYHPAPASVGSAPRASSANLAAPRSMVFQHSLAAAGSPASTPNRIVARRSLSSLSIAPTGPPAHYSFHPQTKSLSSTSLHNIAALGHPAQTRSLSSSSLAATAPASAPASRYHRRRSTGSAAALANEVYSTPAHSSSQSAVSSNSTSSKRDHSSLSSVSSAENLASAQMVLPSDKRRLHGDDPEHSDARPGQPEPPRAESSANVTRMLARRSSSDLRAAENHTTSKTFDFASAATTSKTFDFGRPASALAQGSRASASPVARPASAASHFASAKPAPVRRPSAVSELSAGSPSPSSSSSTVNRDYQRPRSAAGIYGRRPADSAQKPDPEHPPSAAHVQRPASSAGIYGRHSSAAPTQNMSAAAAQRQPRRSASSLSLPALNTGFASSGAKAAPSKASLPAPTHTKKSLGLRLKNAFSFGSSKRNSGEITRIIGAGSDHTLNAPRYAEMNDGPSQKRTRSLGLNSATAAAAAASSVESPLQRPGSLFAHGGNNDDSHSVRSISSSSSFSTLKKMKVFKRFTRTKEPGPPAAKPLINNAAPPKAAAIPAIVTHAVAEAESAPKNTASSHERTVSALTHSSHEQMPSLSHSMESQPEGSPDSLQNGKAPESAQECDEPLVDAVVAGETVFPGNLDLLTVETIRTSLDRKKSLERRRSRKNSTKRRTAKQSDDEKKEERVPNAQEVYMPPVPILDVLLPSEDIGSPPSSILKDTSSLSEARADDNLEYSPSRLSPAPEIVIDKIPSTDDSKVKQDNSSFDSSDLNAKGLQNSAKIYGFGSSSLKDIKGAAAAEDKPDSSPKSIKSSSDVLKDFESMLDFDKNSVDLSLDGSRINSPAIPDDTELTTSGASFSSAQEPSVTPTRLTFLPDSYENSPNSPLSGSATPSLYGTPESGHGKTQLSTSSLPGTPPDRTKAVADSAPSSPLSPSSQSSVASTSGKSYGSIAPMATGPASNQSSPRRPKRISTDTRPNIERHISYQRQPEYKYEPVQYNGGYNPQSAPGGGHQRHQSYYQPDTSNMRRQIAHRQTKSTHSIGVRSMSGDSTIRVLSDRRGKVIFSSKIVVYDTYDCIEYDRRPEPATCNRLNPILAQQIREELNTLKTEMEIHEDSQKYTHFF